MTGVGRVRTLNAWLRKLTPNNTVELTSSGRLRLPPLAAHRSVDRHLLLWSVLNVGWKNTAFGCICKVQPSPLPFRGLFIERNVAMALGLFPGAYDVLWGEVLGVCCATGLVKVQGKYAGAIERISAGNHKPSVAQRACGSR